MDIPVWCADPAGPFQPIPHEGSSWRPEGEPSRLPHEYVRGGTVKILTRFHPANGAVVVEGASTSTNEILHGWMKSRLTEILGGPTPAIAAAVAAAPDSTDGPARTDVPPAEGIAPDPVANRVVWERWQAGLKTKPTLPKQLPILRMLLALDNLAGHKTASFVLWLFSLGIMPLYTPVGGSWLNMAESIQRVLKGRASRGQHPADTGEIVERFRSVVRHWNRKPTPFVWGGKRATRRKRQRERRHGVGGSGAQTRRPIRRRNYGHRRDK